MITKKLNVKLHKNGSENTAITAMIANYNEGSVEFSARDLEGFLLCRKANYPTCSNYELIKDTEEPNTFHISEDGGKTFTLSLEWVEVYELAKVDEEIEAELSTANDLKQVNI